MNLLSKIKILLSFFKTLKNGNVTRGTTFDFERKLAHYLDINSVISVASGTDALIIALKALGIGPGDEVIVPALSFFSTAGAVAWINAKPVFVDIEKESLNIDPTKIEQAITSKTKAIIAVHLNGRMADMERISAIAKKHNLFLIEDAAQAIGSKYKGKSPGYYSDLACFSFNPTKILSSYGDGGAIATNIAVLAEKIFFMKMYGARPGDISTRHPIIGVASRLSQFHAAILSENLKNLDKTVYAWRKNYFLYAKLLRGMDELVLPEIAHQSDYFINGYRYVVLTKERGELHRFLKRGGVTARIEYGVLLPYFGAFEHLGYKRGDFPIAEKISEESLVLPTDSKIPEKETMRTINLIKRFFESS
ncbi:MAG: DegT/DnrJ/EryC1/StrS family aminotransferase [Candidatus Sungbacteria bacterium]|nr:DegT/DnrJ/EryC1/StrS family aminotransferase [Candidatus Sungbacteria bacterium]